MIKIRPSSSGRVIVETDGFDDHYRAYVQGAAVCRISAPAEVVRTYTDKTGLLDFRAFLTDARSYGCRPSGVRIHALRWIR